MALVLFCGLPASGKSTAAAQFAKLIAESNREVQIVTDGDDLIGKQALRAEGSVKPKWQRRAVLYKDSSSEKETRARLRAATERALDGRKIVLCDSLNYIKGYRYELFCVAKTSGTKYCVVYCESSSESVIQVDKVRSEQGEDAFGEGLCRALSQRFEAPKESNRWDSPLFRVNVFSEGWEDSLNAVKAFVLQQGNHLAPTMATRVPEKQGADVLGILDRLTREAESTVISELQRGKQQGERIQISNARKLIVLERKPRIAEFRNMRRSYLNLARMHPPQGKSNVELLDEYVEFVNAQLKVIR